MFLIYTVLVLIATFIIAIILETITSKLRDKIKILGLILPLISIIYIAYLMFYIDETYLGILSIAVCIGFVITFFKLRENIEFLLQFTYLYSLFLTWVYFNPYFDLEFGYTTLTIASLLALMIFASSQEEKDLEKDLEKNFYFIKHKQKSLDEGKIIEVNGKYVNKQYYEYAKEVLNALKNNTFSTVRKTENNMEENIQELITKYFSEISQSKNKIWIFYYQDDFLNIDKSIMLFILEDLLASNEVKQIYDKNHNCYCFIFDEYYDKTISYIKQRLVNPELDNKHRLKPYMDNYLNKMQDLKYSVFTKEQLSEAFKNADLNQTNKKLNPIFLDILFNEILNISIQNQIITYNQEENKYFNTKAYNEVLDYMIKRINNEKVENNPLLNSIDNCLTYIKQCKYLIHFDMLKDKFKVYKDYYPIFLNLLLKENKLISFHHNNQNCYISKEFQDYLTQKTEDFINDRLLNEDDDTDNKLKAILEFIIGAQYETFTHSDFINSHNNDFAKLYLSYLLNMNYITTMCIKDKEVYINTYLYELIKEKINSMLTNTSFTHKAQCDEEQILFDFCEEMIAKLTNLNNEVEYVNSIISYRDKLKQTAFYIILEILKANENIIGIEFKDDEVLIDKNKYDEYKDYIYNYTSGRTKVEKNKIYEKTEEILNYSSDAREYIVDSLGFLSEELFVINVEKSQKTKFYFTNTSENVKQCACCGKINTGETNDLSEWYCSDLCRAVEYSYVNTKAQHKQIDNLSLFATTNPYIISHVDMNTRVFNNPQGHGVAAEYLNDRIDNLSGYDAIQLGNDNAKNGADRIVNGIEIQTKYYSTATRSVNAGFDDTTGMYKYISKNGKPMQLEVPKDQYEKAVAVMENKIKSGKVAGIKDPKMAKSLIRKGNVTYEQAKNYSKFCSKESLLYDATSGAIVGLSAFGISGAISFSLTYLQTKDFAKALNVAIVSGIKNGGMAFCIYMLGTQAQRIAGINALVNMLDVSSSSMFGKALINATGSRAGANALLRGTLVTSVATMAVTSGYEIYKMMDDRISKSQCIKNITVGAGGIAGAAGGAMAGAALGSVVPVVGTFVGGVLGAVAGAAGGSGLMKGIMDEFIDDDNVIKATNFKNQMIYLSQKFMLDEKEQTLFQTEVESYIKSFENFYEEKLKRDSRIRDYNAILKPILINKVISKRTIIEVNSIPSSVVETNIKAICNS